MATPVTEQDLETLNAVRQVQTPEMVGAKLKGIAKRNAAPVIGQLAGQTAGELIGAALAPETGGISLALPIVLGALGAGGANVATNKLPPEYGGNPDESNTSAFLWGALPAAVGGAATKGTGAYLEGKAAKASADAAADFEKKAAAEAERQRQIVEQGIAGEGPTVAKVRNVGHVLGSLSGTAVPPLEGEARTQATDQATNLVLGPINRMRRRLGEPIGKAYEALKGNENRISPQAAADIAEAAQGVRDSLIAPAPKSQAIFARIKHFVPQAPTAPENAIIELPGGEVMQRPNRLPTLPLQYSDMTSAQIAKLAEIRKLKGRAPTFDEMQEILGVAPRGENAENAAKPPTLDELRTVRQDVNKRLRTAKGGDVHALLNLQSALDNHLMEHLPEDIGGMRQSYRGFIKNYPWRDINKLRQAGTPEEVGDWLFGQNPSVINEVVHNATPVERDGYQQLFAQNVLTKVDPELPADVQQKAIQKELQPYLKNGSVRALYGGDTADKLREMVYMPARRAEAAKSLATPEGKQLWNDGFMTAAKRAGKADREAAQAGYQAWLDSLPPEQQKVALQYAPPIREGTETPVLPSRGEALATHLKVKPAKVTTPQFVTRYVLGDAALSLLGAAATSGGSFMLRAGLGFGILSAGGVGYNALIKAGGADLLGKMYESPAGRKAGAAAFRTLVTLGGRALHQEAQPTPEQ